MSFNDLKQNIIGVIFPIIYFVILTFVGNLDTILPSFIMTLALFVCINFVYDHSHSLFTISNLICVVGFFIGYFVRFFLSIYEPSRLTDFAPYPLIGDLQGHLKTSGCFFLFIVVYAFVFRKTQKGTFGIQGAENSFEDVINNIEVVFIYLCILIVSFAYNFMNIRNATQLDYGIFDQFFRFFGTVVKIFAYAHLYLFSKRKTKINLFYYLIYIIPTLYLAFVAAWKGTFFIEVLILCIIFHKGIKKIKKRYIVLFTFTLLTVFPVISMMRDSYRYGVAVDYNLTSLTNYNVEHNIFDFYLDRFEYYDETYYALNVSQNIVAEYKSSAGSIVGRFFSGIIPRIIWQDKPIVNVSRHVTYVLLRYPISIYNNLTIGLLADAYLDNKMFGVVGLALLFGWLVGKNENRKRSKDILVQSYYIVMGKTLFGFLEGDIAAKSLGLIFLVIAYHFCKIILYKNIGVGFSDLK